MVEFVRRYFETRYVMLSRSSLENLVKISQHQIFSPALKTLEICIDHLTERPNLNRVTRYWGNWIRALQQGSWNAQDENCLSDQEIEMEHPVLNHQEYNLLLEEQNFMMESGLNTAYITQALSSFSNVETVIVNNANRPWGATTQKRLTGLFPTNDMDDYDSIEFVKRALLVTFAAIVASKVSLRELDIVAGCNDEAISPDMLIFPKPYLQYFQSLPTSLTSLSLAVSPGRRMGQNDRWASDLMGFMNIFPHIQRLELGFDPRDEHKRFSHIAQVLRLQNLQDVNINGVDCSAEDLVVFLLDHKNTLKEVTLSCIGIPGGRECWQSLLRTVRDKLFLKVLTLDYCQSGALDVFYRDGDGDNGIQLSNFIQICEREDWTDIIEKIRVGHMKAS
ncbi:hypothetical protein DL770_006414 [Monosporascus sp. CRB-9-2]|nr:hypothetical protein DL770_006414 [Monosporascus sp. CRB-9-2]